VEFFQTLSSGLVAWAFIAFLIILGIAWTLLPFAMFGMKPLLRDLIAETRRTNRLLEELRASTQRQTPALDRQDPRYERTDG
jgi:hypothetical protein